MVSEQQEQVARVSGRIAPLVLEFCRRRMASARRHFRASELRAFVESEQPVAPGSADRILRLLRRDGVVAYTVTNRRDSEYWLHGVRP